MKNTKLVLTIGIVFLALASLISMVSADYWQCFTEGQFINFCGAVPDRTVHATTESFCIKLFNSTANCYSSGSPITCNKNTTNVACGGGLGGGGNGSGIDSTVPNLTITSPILDRIYTERALTLSLFSNERSDIYYAYSEDTRTWKSVCKDCLASSSKRSFKEGRNNLIFKVIDGVGNTGFYNTSFFIDTKTPKIKKIDPKKGFADGSFFVQFDELNPTNLNLIYGNTQSGIRDASVPLNSCTDNRGKKDCTIDVNLNDYDGETISYYFTLKDIANQSVSSKPISLSVDKTSPLITSFNYSVSGRKLTIILNITENNFDSINYIDNSANNPIWKTLCTSLKNGVCVKSLTLSLGSHNIDIQVDDEAGNSVGIPLSVII